MNDGKVENEGYEETVWGGGAKQKRLMENVDED